MTTNSCEWCNCEIRSYDQHNPVTSLYYKGKLIYLHALCKDTFFSVNRYSLSEANYYMNIGASGFRVPIEDHRTIAITG